MAVLLHKYFTKATNVDGDQMKRGSNWIFARRAFLKVFDDHLECGDWHIDYSSIQEATLYSVRDLFIPGYVLRIRTPGTTYHFGLNGWGYWRGDLPFPVVRQEGSIGYTPFSIIVRVILVSYLGYWLWSKLKGL